MENSKLGISPSEQHTSEHKAEQEFESSLGELRVPPTVFEVLCLDTLSLLDVCICRWFVAGAA